MNGLLDGQNNNNNGKFLTRKYNLSNSSFALDWSHNNDRFCTLAVGSFLPWIENNIEIIGMEREPTMESPQEFSKLSNEPGHFDYVATKVLWSPSRIKQYEYIATSGDGLNLFRWMEDLKIQHTGKLLSKPRKDDNSTSINTNPPAPVTSFDWNRQDPTILISGSYDTTCTIWSLDTGQIKTQLIAHDKEVFDVQCSPLHSDSFASCGADGSVRLFDIRTLDHSTIIWETPDNKPLLRIHWNRGDHNYIGCLCLDSEKATILDIRMPSLPVGELRGDGIISCMNWAPHNPAIMMTAEIPGKLHLWDLNISTAESQWEFILTDEQEEGSIIQQIVWSECSPDWYALGLEKCIYINHI